MGVVRPEAQATVAEVADGGGHSEHDPRLGRVRHVDDAHQVLLAGTTVGDDLVGDDEKVPARQRHAGVRVSAVFPLQVGEVPWSGAVGDVEDDEAPVALADVGQVAVDQGVVRGEAQSVGPGRLLVAGGPLSGPPPPSGLGRVARVEHVDDDPDPVVMPSGIAET